MSDTPQNEWIRAAENMGDWLRLRRLMWPLCYQHGSADIDRHMARMSEHFERQLRDVVWC
jgi:hypothetical protein